MLLAELAETSTALAAIRSRNAKRDLLVQVLLRAEHADLPILTSYLAGELRQRRSGVGCGVLGRWPEPAAEPTLTLVEVDDVFEQLSQLSGPGSQSVRVALVTDLFRRATAAEQHMLAGLITGELRLGAQDAAMIDAVAAAAQIPAGHLRRAVMLTGSTAQVAEAALLHGAAAVQAFQIQPGRAVRPMLAGSAADVASAYAKFSGPVSVDTKLDGIRIQVHKSHDQIRIFTRSRDDITARLSEVVAIIAGFDASELIIDGELLARDEAGRPRPFQQTAARTATQASPPEDSGDRLIPAFFDLLFVDGESLIDEPLATRYRRLDAIIPEEYRIRRLAGADQEAAQSFFDKAIVAGHEGVVIKDLDAGYQAGRRGSAWVKVKPRHTLDLVVLAVERGSGRRTGKLSNIHLGARDPDNGEFVMLGKTFKGMTDEMLDWQTARFRELASAPETADLGLVELLPQQVVEIAFDGVQRSSRYPAGVALRFARVLRYRDDLTADQADTIDTVRALLPVLD